MLYQTHARIHLDHIRFNIDGIRQVVGATRKILVAVKANAYGHGAVEVSRLAERSGVDWLGVATVPEGIQLRDAGIRVPILKFSPAFPEEMDAAVRNDLVLTVCDGENVDALESVCRAGNVTAVVHLKVDTGMGRLGVIPADAPTLAAHIARHCPHLRLDGVFTHLPKSDGSDPGYTVEQTARFKTTVDAVHAAMGRRTSVVHASNSGAVLGCEPAWLDVVRPGIMVYGFYPGEGTPRTIPLRPGMSVLTRVAFVKRVAAGTSISYGHTWAASEDTWIATIPAGYADGYNRLFSNRGRVLIDGRSYPVVGRVCMDQTMINLGPQTTVKVGDEVVLMGRSGADEISGDEWARMLDTITYEVTCQIGGRVTRVYQDRV